MTTAITHSDVLIVGAGSAGSVVAERLSADSSSTVTVIEAGPGLFDRSLLAQTCGGLKATLLNLDQGVFIEEVFSKLALLFLLEDLFDVVPVACGECDNESFPPDE